LELFLNTAADGRSKHSIYRAVIEVYARIKLSTTNLKTFIYIDCVGTCKYKY